MHMLANSRSARTTRLGGRWHRCLAVGACLALIAAAVTAVTSWIGNPVARRMASRRMAACEFGAAQWWLAWSVWFDPDDYHTALLEATFHRHWKQRDKWEASLDQARRKGAPDRLVAVEQTLGRYQWGGPGPGAEAEIGRLTAAGAAPCDVATAVLRGCLAQQDARRAKAFLENLPGDFQDEAHRDFLWGAYWRSQGNSEEAETRLRRALDARPGHELARLELTALFEDRCQFDRALPECVELAIRSRGSAPATIRLVRVLRAQGRLQEARALLTPFASAPQPAEAVLFEMAWIELESGNAAEAERRLRQLPFGEATFRPLYPLALVTLSFRAKGLQAERLSDKFAARTDRNARLRDLRFRLANNPRDLPARDELQRWERQGAAPSPENTVGPWDLGPERPGDSSAATAGELYRQHCSACHGASGDGHGPASRHLFPRPRSLRTSRCILVSTRNAAPTLKDLEKVLAEGMPGTAMPAFRSLTESQRGVLAQEVLRLRREGVREQLRRTLCDEGEEIDETEIRRMVELITTAGECVPVPRNWPDLPTAAARGRQSYVALACDKCHGDDGTGAGGVSLFDDQGEPARARDLVHEPLKGGHDPQSIYLRIAAGMPGTHHPAVSNLPEQQLLDLVQYVRSLARQPPRMTTSFERRVLADRRD